MLRTTILKPKTLRVLIFSLFLSTTRDISLSLTLLFSGQLLDDLSTSGDLLWLNFILVGVFLLSYIIFSLLSTSSRLIVRRQLRNILRDAIFDYVIHSPSPLEISAEKSLGYLKSVEGKIFEGLNSLLNFITSVLGIIINIIIFNIYNFTVALISLPIIILFILLPLLISPLVSKLGSRLTMIEKAKSAKLLNLINGFSILTIFKRKMIMPKLFKKSMAKLDKNYMANMAKMNAIAHIFALFFFIFYTIINLVVGYFVVTTALGYGAFLVVNALAQKLYTDGRNTIDHLQNFLQIRGISKEIRPQKREIKEIGSFKNITIKDLVFHHKNNEEPLYNNLNLNFELGKKYALVGPSGCGKSTLALILLKLLDPPDQSLFWSNLDYQNLHFEDITKETSFVSGNFTILRSTLRENLTLGKVVEDSKLLEIVNLLGLIDIPLERQIDKESISTGQRQRILVGRALLRNTKLLILDEALANVDRPNAKRILKELLSDKELTLIHITHHLRSEENYDQVIKLGEKNG